MIAGGAAAAAPSPAAPIESRNTSRDPAALNSLKPRSFSDSSSYLLLLVTFVATATVSNLAIAVATAFRKSLIALPSTRPAR
jgi:hypothetical protein